MKQSTVGSKNQIVIPREVRKQVAGLVPGRKVALYPVDSQTILLKLSDTSWLESGYGLMKKAWSKKDPIKQVNRLREEW